jgi:cell division protein FtsB
MEVGVPYRNRRETTALQNSHGKRIALLKKIESLLRKLPSKRNRVLSLVVLLAVPVFVLWAGFRVLNGRQAAAKIDAQNAQLRQQIEQFEAQNEAYLAVLNNDDPEVFRDYVIRTAREQLGLSLPGDQVFIDRSLFKSGQQ